ncbi:MAG: hypothetical protein EA396_01435 [Anaerolineaceae bacterium]|nr:MAG: hypothetical protein EA396_01435 [Anaerolineaceae bacterium]
MLRHTSRHTLYHQLKLIPRLLVLAVAVCLVALPPVTQLAAQNAPDYLIYLPGYRPDDSADGILILAFSVYNRGDAAESPASVEIRDRVTDETIHVAREVIPPLATGSVHGVEVRFSATRYPSGSTQQIEIVVADPEIEAGLFPPMSSNTSVISVLVPAHSGEPPPTADTTAAPDSAGDNLIVEIPYTDYFVDLGDREQILRYTGIGLIAGAVGVLFLMIFNALFRGPPQFGNWQPPYANMPALDPNSVYGRRQQWQAHAHNNLLPASCRPGTIIARKLLNGMDGAYLSGWSVKAIRMTQYDMYGRVSRSQVLASRRHVRRLDKAAGRLHRLSEKAIRRRVRPIARQLARQFRRKVTRRSAMLAIALDIRLQGRHGEVRIVFSLHDCQTGKPQHLDTWEPEMTVLGKAIYDSYTFTVFGQHGGERYRDFRKRLAADVERALSDFLRADPPRDAVADGIAEDTGSAAPVESRTPPAVDTQEIARVDQPTPPAGTETQPMIRRDDSTDDAI